MTTQTAAEQTRRLDYGLTEPLDWFQLRALLWEACEGQPTPPADRWEGVASCVNARCTRSTPHPADTYRAVFERLASEFPEARDIFDVPGAGQRLWTRLLYETVHSLFAFKPVYMNLGFVELDPGVEPPALEEADEPLRPFIQLYQHVLGPAALEGKEVLEVGCGAGGGASFMMRYHRPINRVVGAMFIAFGAKSIVDVANAIRSR